MKYCLTSFKALLVLFVFSGNVLAIGFNGTLSTDQENSTLVEVGGQISISLFVDGFPDTDAGDFALDFGTAGVLAFNSFSAPSFDTVVARDDLPAFGDVLFFVGTSLAPKNGDFAIGTILFDVIGDAGSMTSLIFSDGPSGWQNINGKIPAQYDIGHIRVGAVPVPAAVWFMLSAMGGLGLFRKRDCL